MSTVEMLLEQLAATEADRDLWRSHARKNAEVALQLMATLHELGGAARSVAIAAIGKVEAQP